MEQETEDRIKKGIERNISCSIAAVTSLESQLERERKNLETLQKQAKCAHTDWTTKELYYMIEDTCKNCGYHYIY